MATANSDWWRYTSTAACGVLVTIAVAYFSGAKDWVTRTEAGHMIRTEGPYIEERAGINQKLDSLKESHSEIKTDLRDMSRQLSEIHGAIRRIKPEKGND